MSEELPTAGDVDDLSAFDAQAPLGSGELLIGSDAETIKKINRRSSPITKILFFVILAGVVGLGFWAFRHWSAQDTMMEVFEPIAAMEDPEQRNAALREVLQNAEFRDQKTRAIMNLGHFRDAAAVPQLILALDDDPQVRRSAAWALGRIGSPDADAAKPKLLEVLAETGDVDRNQVVWTLAILGAQDEPFIEALLERFTAGGLQELDGFDDRRLTEVLGIPRLSSEELTNHEEESVRVLTAHALSEAASDEVVAPLARMLTNELGREGDAQSAEVIRAAASGLGRTGSAAAARPLFQMLQNEPGMNDTVIDALRKSTAAPQLASLLGEASDADVRRDLTRLLVETHDRRVVDALAGLLTDEDLEVKSMAALALAEYGDRRAAPVLFELTAVEDDDDMVSDALEALRWVASSEITDQIAALLETHAYRKAAVLRTLGATGDPGAARYIERELEEADVNAAARALATLDHDASFRKLLGKVERPSNVDMTAFNAADRSLANEEILATRRAAILSMGFFGRPDAISALMKVVEDDLDDYELRSMAAAAIGQLGDADTIQTVIGKIGDSSVSEAGRRYYVQALWQRPHREINSQLLDLIGSSDAEPDIRRAAALAVGYAADPAADERLVSLMEDEQARRHAAFAVLLGGGEASVQKLIEWLGADRDLREILQDYVTNTENDWFNLITDEMFESGA
ncbi:MAG: HEAT repeat domain-containing protein, partial [Myxococcota bacterium]